MSQRLQPILIGLLILGLMSFLFLKAQRVDQINEQHATVVNELQQARRHNDLLRRELTNVVYERYHNFDHLVGHQRNLTETVRRLRLGEFDRLKTELPGLSFTLNKLATSMDERRPLLRQFASQVVLLKNATLALGYASEPKRLSNPPLEMMAAIRNYQSAMLSYSLTKDDYFRAKAEAARRDILNLPKQNPKLNEQVSRLLQQGDMLKQSSVSVAQLISQINAIPVQNQIDKLSQAYLNYHEEQEQLSRNYRVGLYIAGTLLLALLVFSLQYLRNSAMSNRRAKEFAETTLRSIGEGVIATDRKERVVFMNPLAERMLQIKQSEVRNLPLRQVFRLHSETTKHPIDNLAERCIHAGEVVEPSQPVCLHTPDGSYLPISIKASPIGRREEPIGAVLAFKDTQQQHQLEEQLSYQVSHDSLTGFFNRASFERALQTSLDERSSNRSRHLVWHLDLDHFSIINDTCGTAAGDKLLKRVAKTLNELLEDGELIARLGGDEFAVLRPCADPREMLDRACQLREAINGIEFRWNDDRFEVNVTIGALAISPENHDDRDPGTILNATKAAVDRAREGGCNRIHIHSRELGEDRSERQREASWIPMISKALDEDRFQLFLQSIAPVAGGRALAADHAEVLIRMQDEQGKLIPPIFIPAAERYHIMPKVDRWVVDNVLRRLAQGDFGPDMCFSINLSGTSVSDSYFLDFIRQRLAESSIDTGRICFEITETAAIKNIKAATYFIECVRDLGCSFALDDFGSGLSSFAYLQQLPVDFLKIDGAFVKQMADNPTQYKIVQAMDQVAKAMGMQTIAEFVENEEILRCLSEIGVNYAQGYGIDAPRPWDTYQEAMQRGSEAV